MIAIEYDMWWAFAGKSWLGAGAASAHIAPLHLCS
jgi:hypothetical protein